MRLVNKTHWDGKELKKFLERIAGELGYDMDGWKVMVGHKTRRYYNGIIFKGSRLIEMNIRKAYPDGWSGIYNNPLKVLAYLFIHELRHRGNDRTANREIDDRHNIELALKLVPDGFQLPLKVFKEERKDLSEIKKERYENVLKKIDMKERKLKRLQNSLKKLYRTQIYYEKSLIR